MIAELLQNVVSAHSALNRQVTTFFLPRWMRDRLIWELSQDSNAGPYVMDEQDPKKQRIEQYLGIPIIVLYDREFSVVSVPRKEPF